MKKNTTENSLFWKTLRHFWNEGRVSRWWDALYADDRGTEKVENMICFSPSAHKMHTKGFIAFEPCAKNPEGYWMTPIYGG